MQTTTAFTVASMENFDPLGIHTGESIVVAPTCSLTQDQVTMLQDLSKQCIRHLGIVGECNIQYAFNADTNDYRVIEVNARLSRSSALASKATGYPLAFVAAKIALGYTLDEIGEMGTPNSAYVAPSLDYLICKIPRWDLTKFVGVSRRIGSSMKSVGEIMSIGRSFEEIIQKGLRMIGQGHAWLCRQRPHTFRQSGRRACQPDRFENLRHCSGFGRRIWYPAYLRPDQNRSLVYRKIKNIVDYKVKLQSYNSLEELPAEVLKSKSAGILWLPDRTLSYWNQPAATWKKKTLPYVHIVKTGILPAVKRINTVASEHPELTNYLYMTYGADGYDVNYYKNEKSRCSTWSGAYRIGSSVEFDWCSVNAIQTARKLGYKSIMINYNPETVSTDYDMCDRLYFDELSFERVLDVIDLEQPRWCYCICGRTNSEQPLPWSFIVSLFLSWELLRFPSTVPKTVTSSPLCSTSWVLTSLHGRNWQAWMMLRHLLQKSVIRYWFVHRTYWVELPWMYVMTKKNWLVSCKWQVKYRKNIL